MKFIPSCITSLFSSHIDALLKPFDVVNLTPGSKNNNFKQNESQYRLSHLRPYCAFEFLAMFLMLPIGWFGLPWEAQGFVSFNLSSLKLSPYVFTHQMFLRSMWPQGDILFLLVVSYIAIVALLYCLTRPIDARFRLTNWLDPINSSTTAILDKQPDENGSNKRKLLQIDSQGNIIWNYKMVKILHFLPPQNEKQC